jgi:hypothetical protein
LLTKRLGSAWRTIEEIERLRGPRTAHHSRAVPQIKRANKVTLAEEMDRRTGIDQPVD